MYRIGHGDCFLLAFAGEQPDTPSYVLIDCGYKPGSPKFLGTKTSRVKDITSDIRDATGGHLDVAVITHEHQDHVNGISEENFKDITIGETWFAWTEDPDDDLANRLRKRFRDKLVGLVAVRDRLAGLVGRMGVDENGQDHAEVRVNGIDDFLAFELGGTDETIDVAAASRLLSAAGGGESANKRSMKVFKDKAKRVRFLQPHEAFAMPRAKDVRVFSLGPPRDEDLLHSLDPEGDESFRSFGARSPSAYLAAAAAASPGETISPFSRRHAVEWQAACDDPDYGTFFCKHYGKDGDAPTPSLDDETPDNAAWRRIDHDWLQSSGQLALDLNNDTNNASLVLAFELGAGGKVLLFAGDAQRGNWVSWSQKDWPDRVGTATVTARDLLARTTLYKVGHHGSHNATLKGVLKDTYANLAWMGSASGAGDFTALITAVRAWAETQKGWDHPQKAIKDALLLKAAGRVLQTDTDIDAMTEPDDRQKDWQTFLSRTEGTPLYFDIVVA